MAQNKLQSIIQNFLDVAGIVINGSNPWDIQVHNPNLYQRLIAEPQLGLGEAYVDGWWDCSNLEQFFYRILRVNIEEKLTKNPHLLFAALKQNIKSYLTKIVNYQSKNRALIVGKKHYDLGNDLFEKMLDKRLIYSCAYWNDCTTLDQAQENKLELICKKLGLKPGMRILDIGCGWGGFAKYAAEKYQVSVVGTTISQEQHELAKNLCAGLPIEIRFQDYRDINEKFDHICSIGMFEHVGYRNYRTYMETVQRCLSDDGLFLLHTIGNNSSSFRPNEWIDKYIFPNGNIPSIKQIGNAFEKLFVMEDWHNFGADYDKTLMAWHNNFNQHYDNLKANYDERFYRMWNYYLLSCAGSFRARDIQLWQIVASKKGLLGGYRSIR